jgi:hypothetical protein
MIGDIYLEKDINNEPRLILKDEFGDEWVISSQTMSEGSRTVIEKKDNCWYFDDKNRHRKATPFV